MIRHIVFRIVAGIVLLAAIAGLGIFAYQAGVAHGIDANFQVSSGETAGLPVLNHVLPYWHFMSFPGFGLFGILLAFFLLFLAFGAMRRLIWGPRWGMRYMRHGYWSHGPWGEGIPPMFAEMHRRAHAAPDWDKAPESDEKI
jgi:hypothetical protein